MRAWIANTIVGMSVAAGFSVGAIAPADAWYHSMNGNLTYYIPGPPPGPYQGACIVRTNITKNPEGDVATIQPSISNISACGTGTLNAAVQIVTLNPRTNQLENGPYVTTGGERWVYSRGPYGSPVFGAHFKAANQFGYVHSWDVTVLP